MSRKWQHICWQAYENNHPTHFFVCNSPHLPTSVQNNVYVHQGCTHGLLAREPLFKIYRYVATFKLFEKWKCGDIDISYRNPSVRNSAFANESGWEKKYLRDSSAPSLPNWQCRSSNLIPVERVSTHESPAADLGWP